MADLLISPIVGLAMVMLTAIVITTIALIARAFGNRGIRRKELEELRRDISDIKQHIADIQEQLADIIIRMG